MKRNLWLAQWKPKISFESERSDSEILESLEQGEIICEVFCYKPTISFVWG